MFNETNNLLETLNFFVCFGNEKLLKLLSSVGVQIRYIDSFAQTFL